MKYLNVFDDKSVLDSSVTSIKHGNGAFVFGVKTAQGIEYVTIYDQRHPGGNCVRLGSVNMEPVRLDSLPTNGDLKIGDVLYSTADGRLTLDAQTDGDTNIPIAICVTYAYENFENGNDYGNGFATARFVSLNYMNCNTPTTGSEEAQPMYFGNYGTTIGNVKGGTDETSYIGGKWNTQKCLHACTKENKDLTNGVTNNSGTGYSPAVCCCVAYSTPGTKPGDWYLPSVGELYKIYANKKTINEKRTSIKGSGFSESYYYWSSREYSSSGEYFVYLSNGYISDYNKDSYYYRCVLGFLALEV